MKPTKEDDIVVKLEYKSNMSYSCDRLPTACPMNQSIAKILYRRLRAGLVPPFATEKCLLDFDVLNRGVMMSGVNIRSLLFASCLEFVTVAQSVILRGS